MKEFQEYMSDWFWIRKLGKENAHPENAKDLVTLLQECNTKEKNRKKSSVNQFNRHKLVARRILKWIPFERQPELLAIEAEKYSGELCDLMFQAVEAWENSLTKDERANLS